MRTEQWYKTSHSRPRTEEEQRAEQDYAENTITFEEYLRACVCPCGLGKITRLLITGCSAWHDQACEECCDPVVHELIEEVLKRHPEYSQLRAA